MGEGPSKPGKLYSPLLVAVATLLGAPVAGCILVGHNLRALGKRSAAWQWLLWGVVGTAALLIVAYFLPDRFPNSALPIGYTLGMYYGVKHAHGAEFDTHIATGGARASAWAAVGVGLTCLVAILGVLFLAILALPEGQP
jgi:hypothetical protein